MFPAKIIEISDKVIAGWYNLPEPNPDDYVTGYDYEREEYVWDDLRYISDREAYESSKVIAEVENVEIVGTVLGLIYYVLLNGKCRNIELNQLCQIEPTTEGKCKIIKL